MTHWKPIETAPKDGTHILLFSPKATIKITGGYWFKKSNMWITGGYMHNNVTAWDVLPEEPDFTKIK